MKQGNVSLYNDWKWHELTITITIPREQITTLGGWASVSRTFDGIRECLADPEGVDEDKKSIVAEEAAALHAPLSNLHMLVRQEIWKEWGPYLDGIYKRYEAKQLGFDEAVAELVKVGVWNWKARQSLREIRREEGK